MFALERVSLHDAGIGLGRESGALKYQYCPSKGMTVVVFGLVEVVSKLSGLGSCSSWRFGTGGSRMMPKYPEP